MAKARRKKSRKSVSVAPAPPPQGDIGPDTPAQRRCARIVTIREPNGAVFQRRFIEHPLDTLIATTHRNGAKKDPEISQRQYLAGDELLKAFCETQLSGASAFTKDFVDSSPDYDAMVLKNTERSSRFGELYYALPADLRPAVNHVILLGLPPRSGLSQTTRDAMLTLPVLQIALDLTANRLRL